MRVLFAGSPEIAVPTLRALARAHQVVGVLTNPESAQGRGQAVKPTAVELAARELWGPAFPILRPVTLRTEARAEVAALKPDILVSFAYGKIFGPKFLGLFPKGGINVHPSLLPRYRGSSPIQQAILDMVSETGVCVQTIALEMDTGDILCVERIPLTGRETSATLSAIAAEIGAKLALQALEAISQGKEQPVPQQGEPSYCQKISKSDGLVDWQLSNVRIDARVRAFNPWPLAYTYFHGQRLNILESYPFAASVGKDLQDTTQDTQEKRQGMQDPPARSHLDPPAESYSDPQSALWNPVPGAIIGIDRHKGIVVQTGDGVLGLLVLQLAGRKALPFAEFANGARNLVGTVLSSRA